MPSPPPPLAVLIVGVFTAIAVASSPRDPAQTTDIGLFEIIIKMEFWLRFWRRNGGADDKRNRACDRPFFVTGKASDSLLSMLSPWTLVT
jgi:hypothetical protein